MDRINYAGESFLTGSAIAHALLDYAQALAEAGASATVEIPTISLDGERGDSEVLVGPASQLISTHVASEFEEPMDPALVDRITASARHLRGGGPIARPHVEESPPVGGYFSEYGI